MIELIVTIFAGLGFCASVNFVISLIGKVYKKIKEKKYYYWNVYYISRVGRDIIFISTPTKDLKPEYIEDIIRKQEGLSESISIVIHSFIEVSKETYEINKKIIGR